MPNLFSTKSAETLCALVVNLEAVAYPEGSGYPFSKIELDALKASQLSTQTSITNQLSASQMEKAATEAKRAGKADLVAKLNALATKAAASSLTNEQIIAIGFAPRRTTVPRPAVPQTPTGLTLEGFSDSTLVAKWSRGSNSKATTFILEVSLDHGATWSMAAAGPRVSLKLEGYAPGSPVWARVSASNAGRTSAPSLPASVYAPASLPSVQLRVA